MNNPNRSGTDKRVYQLQNIEKYRPAARGSQNNASPISAAPTGIGYTVSYLAQYVKSKDADYSPQCPSKIVNADGSPKIMSHEILHKRSMDKLAEARRYQEIFKEQ